MMKSAERAYSELAAKGSQTTLLGEMQTRADLYELLDYPSYTAFDKDLSKNRDG
jgi:methylisocitrate lyase